MNRTSLYAAIIAYEQGELDEQETLELFDRLVATGLAWELQGHYGRTAHDLIESGLIPLAQEPTHRPLDPEEVINSLTPAAVEVWQEHDPYLTSGQAVSAAYAEQKIDLALRTLVDIALLPTTDQEDER